MTDHDAFFLVDFTRARVREPAKTRHNATCDMAEPAALFHAECWVARWKAAGGTVYLGQGLVGDDGLADCLLDLAPTLPLVEPWDSPRRHRVDHLRAMLLMPGARVAVIGHLQRQDATRVLG